MQSFAILTWVEVFHNRLKMPTISARHNRVQGKNESKCFHQIPSVKVTLFDASSLNIPVKSLASIKFRSKLKFLILFREPHPCKHVQTFAF